MESEIEAVRRQLAALDTERRRLEARLRELEQPSGAAEPDPTETPTDPLIRALDPTVTSNSPAAEKIALFRRLFGGRTDVFPVRWDNPKSGRSGYAPACANEWVRGVCGKPQVKCGDCPNEKFIPVYAGRDRVPLARRGSRAPEWTRRPVRRRRLPSALR